MDSEIDKIVAYDAFMETYKNNEDIELKRLCAKALFNKGFRQSQLDQPVAAIKTYDELINLYKNDEDIELKRLCAKALYNKGFRQWQLDQSAAEIKTYDKLLSLYKDDEDIELKRQCAKALNNKGLRQRQLDQPVAAIKTYDELINLYKNDEDIELKRLCAKALNNKGVSQGQVGQHHQAISTYEKLVNTYQNQTDKEILEAIENSQYNLIEIYLLCDDKEKALKQCETVLQNTPNTNWHFPVFLFLKWVINARTIEPNKICQAIGILPENTKYGWGFKEIAPLIKKMKKDKKMIAEQYIAFFEGRIKFSELKPICCPDCTKK